MALNVLSEEDKNFLLSLNKDTITASQIISIFGNTTKKGSFEITPPKIKTTAVLHLKAGEYINKKDVETTAGIFLFNKLMIEGKIDSIIEDGYVNETITKKKFEKILHLASENLMNNKITIDKVVEFLTAFEFWGLKLIVPFSPSFTMNILKPNEEVMKEKNKLLKQYEKSEDKSLSKMVEIEDKLIDIAAKENKNDPGMTLYDSGSRGSFEDNYKNISIMLGPSKNPATNQYTFVTNNYIDGIEKKDLPILGNNVVSASYPKAVGTEVGGYLTKQFYAVFQSIVVDKPGTDCGTKGYIQLTLTPTIINDFLYQYIIGEKGKLILLTPENADQFLNKKVKMRSPMACLSDKICSKCAGTRFETMGIENIGLTTGRISNTLLNAGMKNFHITKVKMNKVDVDTLLL